MTRVVLCFGDSNTYGSIPGETGGRYGPDIRWPGVLARELGDEWRVIEEGLPGRTTVFDDPISPYRRGVDYLPPCLASHAPLDVVTIFLGTNDLKARFAAGAVEIAAGVGELAQIALATTPRVLLLGLPRLVAELSPEFAGAEKKAAELSGHFAERAALLGVEWLDLGDVEYSSLDGIHLDTTGHAAVGATVARRLFEMF